MSLQRRDFLQLPLVAASLSACGGGGGSSSSSPTPAPPPPPAAAWPADYIANASGVTLYVSPNGNDTNPGTLAAPLASIQRAFDLVNPGDTIELADGTYYDVSVLNRSGAAGRYITLKARNALMAKLLGPTGTYSTITLMKVGWVRIEGLDIEAENGHGVDAYGSHHIQVVNCFCHNSGGAGISLEASDYLLVEGNEVAGNATTNTYQASGISIYQARAYDNAASFHILIRRNFVYDNIESFTGLAVTSDGNGIIVDDFQNSQASDGNVAAGVYPNTTLVENNLCVRNGGGGIVVYRSNGVVVRHNTVAGNNLDAINPTKGRGELSNNLGKDNHWYNNVAVCDGSLATRPAAMEETSDAGFPNTGAIWSGNWLFDAAQPTRDAITVRGSGNSYSMGLALSNNHSQVDPALVNRQGTTLAAFSLAAGSPARRSALVAQAEQTTAKDLNNKTRGNPPDAGAIESS